MPGTSYFDNLLITFYKGNLQEETHYYPYVMALQISPALPTDNKNLYQTKELTRTAGANAYNIYNFEARQYDPLLGRFTSIDPMGQFASGYVGMGNNPVNGVDPDGMWCYSTYESEGRYRLFMENLEWNNMLQNDVNNTKSIKLSLEYAQMQQILFGINNTLEAAEKYYAQQTNAMVAQFYLNGLKSEIRNIIGDDISLEYRATEDLEKLLASVGGGDETGILGDDGGEGSALACSNCGTIGLEDDQNGYKGTKEYKDFGGIKGLTLYFTWGTYDLEGYYNPNAMYHYGVSIYINYTARSGTNNLRWVQEISVNGGPPYYDPDDSKTHDETTNYYQKWESLWKNGNNYTFIDVPSRDRYTGPMTWAARVSLVDGNNPVFTIFYGFKLSNYNTVTPLFPVMNRWYKFYIPYIRP